jgi:hypothetical protein
LHNRKFIEENADYKINMKIIANISRINWQLKMPSDEPN